MIEKEIEEVIQKILREILIGKKELFKFDVFLRLLRVEKK